MLSLARFVSEWSRDPSTRTGAVITNRKHRVISLGYNGMAKGILDLPERYENREEKYLRIIHCERNAMIFAQRDLDNCILYTWPFPSCSPCAAMVIQSGIKRVVSPPVPDRLADRWGKDCDLAKEMFEEAGVEVVYSDVAVLQCSANCKHEYIMPANFEFRVQCKDCGEYL